MEKTHTSDGFIISDAITDLEDRFPLKELLIVERLDGTVAYLELFSIMPDRKQLPDGEISVKEYETHKQDDPASIRQKLLRKITKQGQMRKARENYAVIELNDVSIAGDFAVLSSQSGG